MKRILLIAISALLLNTGPAFADPLDAAIAANNRGDYATAFSICQPLAAQGIAAAQSRFGSMYRDGRGVTQDYAEALKWYRLAVAQGNAAAQRNLGIMYSKGHGVAQDYAEALKWYRLAAAQGDAGAQTSLGTMYSEADGVAQDFVESVRWYRKAAEQGDAFGQLRLGSMYYLGTGVAKDIAAAVKWIRLAAAKGNVTAQAMLGLIYSTDDGVAKDDAESLRWFRLAATQGDATAQYYLGKKYGDGQGVTQDYAEAEKWYRLAAAQGNAEAQASLGSISTAHGLAKNDAEPTTRDTEVQRTTLSEAGKTLQVGNSEKQSSSTFDVVGTATSWILLLGGVTGYLAFRSKKRSDVIFAARSSDDFVGINGWLRFFVISIGILGPALSLGAMASGFYQLETTSSAVALSGGWGAFKTVTWLTLGLFSAFNIYAALQMRFIWIPSSVTLAKVAVVAWALGGIFIDLVVPQIMLEDTAVPASASVIGKSIVSIFISTIWFVYLSNSKRVKATYFEQLTLKQVGRMQPLTMEEPSKTHEAPEEAPVERSLSSVAHEVNEVDEVDEVDEVAEEKMYDAVDAELESGSLHRATWLKAFAQASGDENFAKATYIKLRIERLRAEKSSEKAA